MYAQYIKLLKSSNENLREKAKVKLMESPIKQELDIEDLEEAIISATKIYKNDDDYEEDCCVFLLNHLSNYDMADVLPTLEQCFPNFSKWGRSMAYTICLQTGTTEASDTFFRLLDKYKNSLNTPGFEVDEEALTKETTNLMFPKLLNYIDEPTLAYSIDYFLLMCLQARTLTLRDLAEYLPILETKMKYNIQTLATFEKVDLEDDLYVHVRKNLGLYLDIIGYSPEDYFPLNTVQACLNLQDPRVLYFAAISLLKQGVEVKNDIFKRIATNRETRASLFDYLNNQSALDRFPSEFLTQEKIAESMLTQWIWVDSESHSYPKEMMLMKEMLDTDEDGEEMTYFVFKFSLGDKNADNKVWYAGLSGPFYKKDGINTLGWECTYSNFEIWEQNTPAGHLEDILYTLTKYWEVMSKIEKEGMDSENSMDN